MKQDSCRVWSVVFLSWILWSSTAFGQAYDAPKGRVVVDELRSDALSGNPGGEDPVRSVTVYLPPGYEESSDRYPTIYYLHGFTWSDRLVIERDKLDELLDRAVANGVIRKTIVVLPNQHTLFKGSFYTNSSLTGNWVDFTATELVDYVDKTYRTIPDRDSRGLAGHSMGGNGALKIGMLRPDVFGAIYALSPAAMGWADDFSLTNPGLKLAASAKTREEVFEDFYATAFIAMCRAFSPNTAKEPFQCDLPASFEPDGMTIDDDVFAKWNEQLPVNMIANHLDALKSLNAIKLDWGRNDSFTHIPPTSLAFSEELESLGIEHYAEVYIGTHGNKLWTTDGRAYNDMLPFFNTFLHYE